MMRVPATSEDLFRLFGELGIAVRTAAHPPLHTVAESRLWRGDIEGAHTKNLFLKCKKGALYLVCALESAEADLKNLHKKLGSARLSFGKPELLMEALGVTPGSVTPFALINDVTRQVRLVLDAALMAEEALNFHPLENTATSTISRNDFMKFLCFCGHAPLILPLSGEAAAPLAKPAPYDHLTIGFSLKTGDPSSHKKTDGCP